jgi:flagellin-specific chaperone FliS
MITFELADEFLIKALAAPSDTDEYLTFVGKAKDAVMQLINGLDFTSPLAQDFYDIYQYIYKLLTDAFFKRQTEPAAESLELVSTLLSAWKEAAAMEAAAGPAMAEHAPQVYAGLTYQRDGLSEYVMPDDSRDFKA